jgi:uncharacterized protein YcbK (DUF882 family)
MDWDNYPNFRREEFACRHCGQEQMDENFMNALQALRTRYGKPMIITSGYRCKDHPVEAEKVEPGAHTSGCAADIAIERREAHRLLQLALEIGFTGIGVNQKGPGRFLHLDTLPADGSTRPTIWSY